MSKLYRGFVSSKYKYVHGQISCGKIAWIFRIEGKTRQRYDTEKEAALAADKYLILEGNKPVNILKRK